MQNFNKITGFILLFFALLLPIDLQAAAIDPAAIIRQVEDNLNGTTLFMKLTMIVKTKRGERKMKMDSYSIGKNRSFIKITYPGKDRGITFLKIDDAMWQYVPRIEKIIKIPASMMLQSWMGSDFSNDDLVKESSISEDYAVTLTAETDDEYEVLLIPFDDAPVVWGKIIMFVSKKLKLPTTVTYFDEDGLLVRTLHYLEVRQFGDRFYPGRWVMQPETEEKAGHQTIVIIDDAVFDKEISASYFTKRALKRYSR